MEQRELDCLATDYPNNPSAIVGSGNKSYHLVWDTCLDKIVDAIMDRIIHNSYILILDSKKSMREVMAEKTIKNIEKDEVLE